MLQIGQYTWGCSTLLAQTDSTTGAPIYPIAILVNIAVNKGHHAQGYNGGTTLCQKNHVGSLKFDCPLMRSTPEENELAIMNKSEVIMGGTPTRQQLCIVDSLWAHIGGPHGGPDRAPARLVMGTFAPAVDYLCAKKIREGIMGATRFQPEKIERYLGDFGYDEKTRQDLIEKPPEENGGREWVETVPTALTSSRRIAPKGSQVRLKLTGLSNAAIPINLPIGKPMRTVSIAVLSLQGQTIVRLPHNELLSPRKITEIRFNGSALNAGKYLVAVHGRREVFCERFRVF